MTIPVWETLSVLPGTVAVVAEGERVVRILFCRTPLEVSQEIAKRVPGAVMGSNRLTHESLVQLKEYFQGSRRRFQVPLDESILSLFARKVHASLENVPYGTCVSYGRLAALAGHPRAARATGRVMSSNPFPLVIPCHRVICADGRVGDYTAADGVRTKAWLLDFEQKNLQKP